MLPASLDPAALRAMPGIAHWFRYPLHARDFRPLRASDDAHAKLLGYYAAKPLYGRLDARGRVDRGAGFNGEVAALFVPSPARSWKRVRIAHARMPRDRVQRSDGRRNWPAIRQAAERALRRALQ